MNLNEAKKQLESVSELEKKVILRYMLIWLLIPQWKVQDLTRQLEDASNDLELAAVDLDVLLKTCCDILSRKVIWRNSAK